MAMRCIACKGINIQEVVENNRRYYYCATCDELQERIMDSRYGKDVTIPTAEGVTHISVGAIIRNPKDPERILLIKRRSFPFGFDIPAGHVEYNEKPLEAVKREVLEELGLHVKRAKLVYNQEMKGNRCRYGAESHIWYVYDCECDTSTPFLNPEGEAIGWYTRNEALNLDLVPSAHYLFTHAIQDE